MTLYEGKMTDFNLNLGFSIYADIGKINSRFCERGIKVIEVNTTKTGQNPILGIITTS